MKRPRLDSDEADLRWERLGLPARLEYLRLGILLLFILFFEQVGRMMYLSFTKFNCFLGFGLAWLYMNEKKESESLITTLKLLTLTNYRKNLPSCSAPPKP